LVAFPEMTLTGYPVEDLALRASFQRAAAAAVGRLAAGLVEAGLGDLTVVVGSLGTAGTDSRTSATAPRPTNRAIAVRGGDLVATYDKRHLPNYGVFDEYRIFAPGDAVTVLEVDGRRVGLAVCEDIWQDDGPASLLAGSDLDLLLVLNCSPFEE